MGVDDIILNEFQGTDFESKCADILRSARLWRTERTGKTQDGGKDIVMTTDKGKTVYVECKAWSERVTPKEIRAFHSVCVTDKVDGYFISASGYTPKALEEAALKRIITYDASDLIAMVHSYDRFKHPVLFSESPITMDNARRNKVGVIRLTNTLKRPAVPKIQMTVDGIEAPPVKAGCTLYTALADGRHSVHLKTSGATADFDIDLKGEAGFKLISKLTGIKFVMEDDDS